MTSGARPDERSPGDGPSRADGARDRTLVDFRNRLARIAKHRRRWASRGIPCHRLYDRDVPGVAVSVDRYGEWIQVCEYDPEAGVGITHTKERRQAILEVIREVLLVPADRIALKVRERQRGLAQYERRDGEDQWLTVEEHGLKFRVNLTGYLDTGLFLDHRETRRRIRDRSLAKHFLNLFAYTGSFTVYAAAGGALTTNTVDLSNTYLDWARENLAINDLSGSRHRFVRDDVLRFLSDHLQEPTYDLVVVDPPTFSNSKRTPDVWDIQRDHAPLLERLRPLLRHGFEVIFSTNSRRFRLDHTRIANAGYAIREITRQTIPEDFRGSRIHRAWELHSSTH